LYAQFNICCSQLIIPKQQQIQFLSNAALILQLQIEITSGNAISHCTIGHRNLIAMTKTEEENAISSQMLEN